MSVTVLYVGGRFFSGYSVDSNNRTSLPLMDESFSKHMKLKRNKYLQDNHEIAVSK